MALSKASDKPNELNDINGVYEANTVVWFTSLIWREDSAILFDVFLLAYFV